MDQLTDAADFVEPLLQPVAQASTTDSEKGTTVRPCNREITNPNDDDDDSRSQNSSSSARSSSTDSNNNRRNPWKNHNVVLSLVWCVIAGTADSIWTSVVLSGFLLALSSSMGKASEGNTLVGIAEAVQGLTQLVTALPVGYYADRFGKAHAVRFGGYLMTATIAITLWALIVVKRDAEENVQRATFGYWVLVVALGLWGIVNGISYGPSQALFSDSIPKGKRSEMLTWLYSCYMLSSSVGPIVSIILIITVSSKAEDWSIHEIFVSCHCHLFDVSNLSS
jgi:MFS family permease